MNSNLIKNIGKWSIFIQGNDDYCPNNLMVTDGYISYYMNSNKHWDNFYPLPKSVIKYCETTGYNKLLKHLEKEE